MILIFNFNFILFLATSGLDIENVPFLIEALEMNTTLIELKCQGFQTFFLSDKKKRLFQLFLFYEKVVGQFN